MVQGPLREWTAKPSELASGDERAMDGLTEGLIMSGLAMQAHQSSRPASGAEHQFSHMWEGEGLGRELDPPLSHGFKVGVGSVAVAALFERLLERDLSTLDVDEAVERWPDWGETGRGVREACAGSKLENAAGEETRAKCVGGGAVGEGRGGGRGVWPGGRERVREQVGRAGGWRGRVGVAGGGGGGGGGGRR